MLAFCEGNLTLIIPDQSQGGGAPVHPSTQWVSNTPRTGPSQDTQAMRDTCGRLMQAEQANSTQKGHKHTTQIHV